MLLDLRHVTEQLSALADATVQACLDLLSAEMEVEPADFVVLALGKLGGRELNYSSDIDLIFLCERSPGRFWKLGQRLIRALRQTTGEGFLYRVDMRLRPWGKSGALVNSVDAHLDYLRQHGQAWEKQALLKARPIAGDLRVGERFLEHSDVIVYSTPADEVRESVREMKSRIEHSLERRGRAWGHVKAGAGSIRDIEFVTQCLQLIHGGRDASVRGTNTMSALARLAEARALEPGEYSRLASGYGFLRTVEHALQLMHYQQAHSLPESPRELAYLARRLEFSSADGFLRQYELHCQEVRRIYRRHVERLETDRGTQGPADGSRLPDVRSLMEPSYAEIFDDDDIQRHAELLGRLAPDHPVDVDARELAAGQWQLTIVGYNHVGELSLMCGLLLVHGFSIADGNVFTGQHVASHWAHEGAPGADAPRQFVNVFVVIPQHESPPADIWTRYRDELSELVALVRSGELPAAHGRLAKRVAAAVRLRTEPPTALSPVTIAVDNETPRATTALHIEADDTIGFLYEMTNALALAGVEIERVSVRSHGHRVADTLFVTDSSGRKITDATRLIELRATIVLIKHFTHLLPHSPNPESALLHFRSFLEQLIEKADWNDLSSLEQPEVLEALARLLGGQRLSLGGLSAAAARQSLPDRCQRRGLEQRQDEESARGGAAGGAG